MDLFKLVGRIVISNQEANESIDETTQKAQGLASAMEGTSNSADTAGKKMGSSGKFGSAAVWMGNMYTKVTEKAMALGKFIGKTGFGFDANMEAYQNQFEALIGDADKASQLVAELQLLAKVSPLGMEGLANNAVSLLNTGTELADIIPTLEMLGNLALGDTNKMNSIVRAYTQILSKGQLMAQEMYQLGDAGVPIREIMTMYGGEAYEDGSWYALKMKDPTYKIMAEDMVTAFQGATAEGGKWHDYMFKMMDTWLGQTDRLGEEGKESLGAFMNPFFEVAKSDVLPRLSESLKEFGTWVTNNQGTLEKLADATGKLVTGGFDMIIGALEWMMENGEATAVILGSIGAALAVGAIAAHPYAAAIMAIVAGLAALKSRSEGLESGSIFGKYSEKDLQLLQKWVDVHKEVYAARVEGAQNGIEPEDNERMQEAIRLANEYHRELQKIDGLQHDYIDYNRTHGGDSNKGIWLDVPTQVSDDSEAAMQGELDGMTLEAMAKIHPDLTEVYNAQNHVLTFYANVVPNTNGTQNVNWKADGAVFSKPTIFNTRYGLQGVGEAGPEAVSPIGVLQKYVSEAVAGQNAGMVSVLQSMLNTLNQINANTASGHQVVLDGGALVGQLAPALDVKLGTMASRKGRRN